MNTLLHRFLSRVIVERSLEVVDSDGKTHRFGDGSANTIRVRFTAAASERDVVLQPDLKLGEEYMNGGIVMESGSIFDLLELAQVNLKRLTPPWWFRINTILNYLVRRLHQINTPARARANVHHHYDLDGRLYK